MSLSPVPEAQEGDDDEEKEKERSPPSSSTTTTMKASSQPPTAAAHRGAMRPINTSTSTLSSQQSSVSDLTKKGMLVTMLKRVLPGIFSSKHIIV